MVTTEEIDEKYGLPDDVEELIARAKRLFQSGQIPEAHEITTGLLEKHPRHPKVLNAVGSTYKVQGDFERAEEYYLRAIDNAADYVYAYNNLSLLYCGAGRHEKAAYYARLTIKIMKSSPIPWCTLGSYYLTQGEVQRGLEHFLAAYEYDPSFTQAAYNIACCYSKLNEPVKALEYLAISLDNRRRIEIAEQDIDLDNIRNSAEFQELLTQARDKFGNE